MLKIAISILLTSVFVAACEKISYDSIEYNTQVLYVDKLVSILRPQLGTDFEQNVQIVRIFIHTNSTHDSNTAPIFAGSDHEGMAKSMYEYYTGQNTKP